MAETLNKNTQWMQQQQIIIMKKKVRGDVFCVANCRKPISYFKHNFRLDAAKTFPKA